MNENPQSTLMNDANISFVGQNALLYIVHGFRPKSENFDLGIKGYHWKGHLKGNRMIAPSSEEQKGHKE